MIFTGFRIMYYSIFHLEAKKSYMELPFRLGGIYLNVLEPCYHWDLNPHAPRLLLTIIPNYSILSTNLHNLINEFVMQLDVVNPTNLFLIL